MQSWTNRVSVDMHGKDTWLTCPVKRESGPQFISEVQINYDQDIENTWAKLFLHAYKKAPNYEFICEMAKDLLAEGHMTISAFNQASLETLCKLMGIKVNFVRHSDLGSEGQGNELLKNICLDVECDTYLSGTGAQDYMDLNIYAQAGIKVVYQDYLQKIGADRDKKLSVLHHLFRTPRALWGTF